MKPRQVKWLSKVIAQGMSRLGFTTYPVHLTLESLFLCDLISFSQRSPWGVCGEWPCSPRLPIHPSGQPGPAATAMPCVTHSSHSPDLVPVSYVWPLCTCACQVLCFIMYVCDLADASVPVSSPMEVGQGLLDELSVVSLLLQWFPPGAWGAPCLWQPGEGISIASSLHPGSMLLI